jgi:FkbM family methyltransferase
LICRLHAACGATTITILPPDAAVVRHAIAHYDMTNPIFEGRNGAMERWTAVEARGHAPKNRRRSGIGVLKSLAKKILPRTILNRREADYFLKYGEQELILVRHLCRPHQDAIDIGANEGGYVHFMKRHARHVLACEPVPELVDKLLRKFKTSISVKNIALSNTAGAATLCIPLSDGEAVTGLASLSPAVSEAHPTHKEVVVKTAPLDGIYRGEVGFIKIDVEGHEEAVIEGAHKTIARSRPRILVEIEEDLVLGGLKRISAFFRELDYEGFYAHRQKLERLETFNHLELQRPETLKGFGPGKDRKSFPDYVNNFIFIPQEDVVNLTPLLAMELARS